MKNLKTLILLTGTMALTTAADAWIVVRRPIVVVPYVAPYPAVVVAPAYYGYAAPATGVYVYGATPPAIPIGTDIYVLPLGAKSANINGIQYYVVGATYYRPQFGPNGVYYQVVANPV